jgi:ABC-2 type transport system ATP-binding protein
VGRTGDAAVIACEGLGKSFDDAAVVRGIDLHIAAGSIVGLIGPSGCGKTTTVRLLTGLYEPTAGWAKINGRPSTRLTDRERQQIGYLPQIPALFPELSLWENLSFHASMYGLRFRRRRRLRQLLSWVELEEHADKRVREVSGGMQRRLALAASFVHDPPILFLDEPTAGIDPILRAKFWERFRELREGGRTMLVTTQYVGEASYCDVVGLLSDGELLMVDTPENLRRAAFDGEVIDVEFGRRIEAGELARLADLPIVIGAPEEVEPRRWRVVVSDADIAVKELGATLDSSGLPVVEIKEHIVDYDEAFVRVIERSRRKHATAAAALVASGER